MSNYSEYPTEPDGLGSLQNQASPSLGSLKKHAHSKNLRSARIALVVACIVMGLMAFFNYVTAERQIDDQIKKELRQMGGGVGQHEIQQAKEGMMRVMVLLCLGIGFISLVFLILAILVYRYPLFCTVGGLIFFIGFNLIMAFLIAMGGEGGDAVAFLASGFIWKIIILVGLGKGIQSAVAFQRERAESQNFHDSQLQTDV